MSKRKDNYTWESLSKNRKLCDGKRVIKAQVRLIVCGVTTNQEARQYVEEAVRLWGGQLEPPREENSYAGDPLCTCYTHLVSATVRDSRLSQDDVTSYLAEAETGHLEEYPDDVE